MKCPHATTHHEVDPSEPDIGPSIEVCADCGASRKHWEQGESDWVTPLEEFRRELTAAVQDLPLKDAGLLVLDVARAFLAKQNNYTPHGAMLVRLGTADGKLTVCLARDGAALRPKLIWWNAPSSPTSSPR